ncbi:hypothetical protein [Pseudomonas sp. NPDC099000]|uniref:hypothetical protein n=1 Tax=Pseudomonas sp. NPDC099000 TaxID=3364488 RepID=UPI00383AA848
MSIPPKIQACIEQLHRDVAALAEDMRSPAPTAARTMLLPFSLGAAFALVTFVVVALVVPLV